MALEAENQALAAEVRSVSTELVETTSKAEALEATFAGVSREGTTLKFSGMNLQLLNGKEFDEETDGLGNLIVGHDEEPLSQTGSADIVLGTRRQEFTSFGDLVGGEENHATGPYADTLGINNQAAGEGSSVVGGAANLASGELSMVAGGSLAVASGETSAVAGGLEDEATAHWSTAVGGSGNRATGRWAFARGGENHTVPIWS